VADTCKRYQVSAQEFAGAFTKSARQLLHVYRSYHYREVYEMTRTLGAALGVVIVLLFFASLTFEQNRVVAVARAAALSHK